jgi:(E)-4-hydroxy-3-methylbut-2-enyl-diphosphate synthase
MQRKKTKVIDLGGVKIGGENPIRIQSMTNTPTYEIEKTLAQIQELARNGAEIVRLAVLGQEDATALDLLIRRSPVPLVADIHFDHRLALKALDAGISGLRLNPGNIREKERVAQVVEKAGERSVPIRIGVNAGSLDPNRFPHADAHSMVQSALEHIEILENLKFDQIKVSLKASDVRTMIEANRLFSEKRDYPLHLGVTEAGTRMMSAVRSSIGIGTLLLEGIGDTIRVSVSGDPVQELTIAREILISLGLQKGIKWIACPTCGRTRVDVAALTGELESAFQNIREDISIAVMGCMVNGPGEAREADLALVGGERISLIYRNGLIIKKIPNENLLSEMKDVIQDYLTKKK